LEHDFRLYVGIDWGGESHHICLLDSTGRLVQETKIKHEAVALAHLCDHLLDLAEGKAEEVAVALETSQGIIVETLLERGLAVHSINPKQLDRFRDRYSPAGAKDDRRDARVLAEALRTDRPRFRRLEAESALILEVKELTRTHDELQRELTRTANRLRDLLARFYPQVLTLSPAANETWVWELLQLAPTPEAGARLRRERVEKLLKAHRISRLTWEQVLDALRAPAFAPTPATVQVVSERASLLLPRLQLVADQLKRCDSRLRKLVQQSEAVAAEGQEGEHRDLQILLSFPGVGDYVAATVLAEAWQPLAQRDYDTLRAQMGIAPVTRRSGKQLVVGMRHACKRRLRNAGTHWARKAIQDHHWRLCYDALRARGHPHARALRGVMDRILAVLIAALRTNTLYDPTRLRS
jgi:transposase